MFDSSKRANEAQPCEFVEICVERYNDILYTNKRKYVNCFKLLRITIPVQDIF